VWAVEAKNEAREDRVNFTCKKMKKRGRSRVRRFRQKKLFALKRNEAKRDPFRMRFARLREKKNFSLFFAANFSLPIKAKLIWRIFSLCFTSKHFSFRIVSLLLCFVYASFHFRFASDTKTSKKTFFSHWSEKILLPFRFKAKVMAVFRFRFASFHFEVKIIKVFRSRFASFYFEAKMREVFRFRFV
jgi:hypothetical protein